MRTFVLIDAEGNKIDCFHAEKIKTAAYEAFGKYGMLKKINGKMYAVAVKELTLKENGTDNFVILTYNQAKKCYYLVGKDHKDRRKWYNKIPFTIEPKQNMSKEEKQIQPIDRGVQDLSANGLIQSLDIASFYLGTAFATFLFAFIYLCWLFI